MRPGEFVYDCDTGALHRAGEWEMNVVAPLHDLVRVFTNNYVAWWLAGVDIVFLYKGNVNRLGWTVHDTLMCCECSSVVIRTLSLSLSLCSRLLQVWHRREKHVFVWTVNEREDILHYRNELGLAVLTDKICLAN